MGKNIVICLDGTGNELRARGNTNVVRTFDLLELNDRARQIGFYDPGVGTFSAPGAWTPVARRVSRLTGLAFGTGLKSNLSEAYTYLIQHYEPGDEIYIFGFSRGAYTARALAGLLASMGLLRPGAENLVPYAVAVYARNKDWTAQDWELLHEFARIFSRKVDGHIGIPVKYMGLWDTVKAAGFLRWGDLKWLYTRQLPTVAHVRHAMSIDERRRPYRPYPVIIDPKAKRRPELEQLWFAGVHSDVGGTFDDDPRLPRIALKWVIDGARQQGLLVDPATYQARCTMTDADAEGKVHKMGGLWAVLGYKTRDLGLAPFVHESVRTRMAAEADYRPSYTGTPQWCDPGWVTPYSPA